MTHQHRFRPIWLLLVSPAWHDGWHRIITRARCLVCGAEATLAGWQSPRAAQARLAQEGE
jgi:hypothetical protein